MLLMFEVAGGILLAVAVLAGIGWHNANVARCNLVEDRYRILNEAVVATAAQVFKDCTDAVQTEAAEFIKKFLEHQKLSKIADILGNHGTGIAGLSEEEFAELAKKISVGICHKIINRDFTLDEFKKAA